ncbi:oxidoreductase [candidate division KSB1 bacterium 4484_87]|nr:MAG: oxidoreductase [candidate division KSB1 bacterium 4484_87]
MNIAVIGLGYWGPNLLRNLYESQTTEKLIACDLDETKLQRIKLKYPTVEIESDYQKLLRRDDIDAAIVATPVSLHFPIAHALLEAGKHVFVEKPMTQNSQEAEKLVETAEKNNRVLMVGHTFEYSPPVLKIKELIDSKELGDVYYISMSRVNLGLHQKDVSVIWDLAPHDFSMLFYWLNQQPKRISAMGKDCVQKNIPDVAFINIEFPDGCIANMQVSWLAPSKLRRTAIVGNKKMLVYDDTENIEKVKIYDKGVEYKDPETFGEYQLSYRSGDIISPYIQNFEPLRREMNHFIECCQNGKKPISDGRSGLRVIKALEAAEKSLRNNSQVVEIA